MAIEKFRLRVVAVAKLAVKATGQLTVPYSTTYPGTLIAQPGYNEDGAFGIVNGNGTVALYAKAGGTLWRVIINAASGTATTGTAVPF